MPFRCAPRSRSALRLCFCALVACTMLGTTAGAALGGGGAAVSPGRQPDGSVLTPSGQFLTPAGRQITFPGMPTGAAIRPDGRTAAVHLGSANRIVVIDLGTATIKQVYSGAPNTASFDGIAYSPDGKTLYTSGAGGNVEVTGVNPDGTLAATRDIALPASSNPAQNCCTEYPGGIAPSAAGSRAYVALSRDNTLGIVDTGSLSQVGKIAVGNAPHSVIVSGTTAYVSDEGGRRAVSGDVTDDSGGTPMVVDPFTSATSTGAVSVVDLAAGTEVASITVGLHPTAMLLQDGFLFVANTNSDTVSVIDTSTRKVVNTIAITPFSNAPYGSVPTGLAMLPGGRLVVSLGRDNALAVYRLTAPTMPATFLGMLPVGWYPSDVLVDNAHHQLLVTNDQGVGSADDPGHPLGAERGSVSLVPFPSPHDLAAGQSRVAADNGWNNRDVLCPDPAAKPTAIPARLGEPSLIKHVVYIIKENKTYDSVLGDVAAGNGDPSRVMYGSAITPNQHALAATFGLADNFYDSGRRSNDGHNWAVQGMAPDEYQKASGNDKRSDPFNLGIGTPPSSGWDAMLYLPNGFIWEDALEHGKSFDDYGEYTSESQPPPAKSDKASLEAHLHPEFSGFELTTPDAVRADIYTRHLQEYVASGVMPDLTLITLPDDHTGGSNPLYPTPQSEVADNDYGTGKIVDAISHSQFWANTAIFVDEDDSQGGSDHVEGHRSTFFLASPYARRGIVDSNYYTQLNVLKTIEMILGLPPLNQLDMSAVPMRSLFTDTPDASPFTAVAPAGSPPGAAARAMNPPVASLTGMHREWAAAMADQDFRHRDAVNPELLQHDLWYEARGWTTPFPGDARVLHPWEVPGGEAAPDDADSGQSALGAAGAEGLASGPPLPVAPPSGGPYTLLLPPALTPADASLVPVPTAPPATAHCIPARHGRTSGSVTPAAAAAAGSTTIAGDTGEGAAADPLSTSPAEVTTDPAGAASGARTTNSAVGLGAGSAASLLVLLAVAARRRRRRRLGQSPAAAAASSALS